MGRLFGTDGARGVAITELTCELAMQIGRAAALVLTRNFIGQLIARGGKQLDAVGCGWPWTVPTAVLLPQQRSCLRVWGQRC